jgi:hypothetical protein
MNYHELTLFFDWLGPIVAVAQMKEAVRVEIRAALRSGRYSFEPL